MQKVINSSVFGFLFLFFSISNASALSLNVAEDGTLLGAYDVVVGEMIYNVSFLDQAAEDIYYNSITDQWDFTFNTYQQSWDASQALLDQVLTGEYDSNPGLVNGIDGDYLTSMILTPFTTGYASKWYVIGNYANNQGIEANDKVVQYAQFMFTESLALYDYWVYAKWDEIGPVSGSDPVPEPGSMILLGSGLLGIACRGRIKRRKL